MKIYFIYHVSVNKIATISIAICVLKKYVFTSFSDCHMFQLEVEGIKKKSQGNRAANEGKTVRGTGSHLPPVPRYSHHVAG